ncbi:NADH dehydrogenase (ubiquinone) complex I, assembly factor [Alteripontixanthobacter maritimus]|uniref:NADH dehydrogenase (Ubiquinone) complex I, assembly factor n=1 Tax=Alteripontixanthobacter maritimus TaxID=2161824 RepID=A0A369Q6T8_9SPHN|nr:SAM-dependent methyltransferase [Alteripontixanthobacter maritimus]RDC59017.1 NADH dehydrogenase (ubiquinone) complex I, assembly factor [Alteripontixanthobacter maritimus]
MSLADTFRRLIRNTGPISLAQFMGESNAQYYSRRDPLGRPTETGGGDFVTAPEISQMFGELIGLWLADIWIRAGGIEPVHYVELGPGRGTLAKDALRSAKQYGLVPHVHFVETSPALTVIQRSTVPDAIWHSDLSTVPLTGPVLIVGNEFLDALPVRQLVRTTDGWRERMVGLADDAFGFVAGMQPMDAAVPAPMRNAEPGTILETCPAAAAILYEIAGRLAGQGGAALLIDYGHNDMRAGSTLQAVRAHQKVDPLATPGEADLTALVDFATLARIAQSRDAVHMGTVTQGDWLRAMGIEVRAEQLAQKAPQYRDELMAAKERLIAPDQMGELFKVMGLGAPGWPEGAGFAPE